MRTKDSRIIENWLCFHPGEATNKAGCFQYRLAVADTATVDPGKTWG